MNHPYFVAALAVQRNNELVRVAAHYRQPTAPDGGLPRATRSRRTRWGVRPGPGH